jgi:predicted thioesterase
MEFQIKEGASHEVSLTVSAGDTASRYGSGLLEVFATPALVALMERAAMELIQPAMPEGLGTVGVHIEVRHLKATAVGREVWARAILLRAEGKRFRFSVSAWDKEGPVGEGTHTRVAVDTRAFMDRLQ